MTQTKGTIYFRNNIQKALFECELKGQISDGNWENSRPMNHWEGPCRAAIEVDPTNPRVDGVYLRRLYDFANKELLDIVGQRMVNICNLTEAGYDSEIVDAFNEFDGYKHCENEKNEYWTEKFKLFYQTFGSWENYHNILSTGKWNMKNMKKELQDMKKTMRNQQ